MRESRERGHPRFLPDRPACGRQRFGGDSAAALLDLFRALQRIRVRPYYVFQCDPVAGISHFRVPLERAVEIARACADRIGGLGLPRFVADIPGSTRKMPIELL